ncbi:MAG: GNAT family N-acetyltransferase [Candidatus Dormibacteria bacterium]|jgi:ribosomal protein S18 acetylase RimI-like enzyme
MQVRSASYRDLSQVDSLYRTTMVVEEELSQKLAAAGPHSPVPGAALARAWSILTKSLSALMPLADVGDQLYVAEDDGRIVGFVQAEPAPGGRAWQILNLCLDPTSSGHFAGVPLLQHLFNEGLERGVTRFLVRIPDGHALASLLREQGFQPYASEQISFRELPKPPRVESAPWRPAHREDLLGVYLLYLNTAPHSVAAVEAPSLKQWRATFQLGWLSRLDARSGDSRHYVVEKQSKVVAWAGIRDPSQARPTQISLMLDPQERELAVEAVHSLLGQLPAGPTVCLLRHYDGEVARAVAARGFEPVATQSLMARDLPLKLRARQPLEQKKRALASALPVAQAVRQPELGS